MKKPIAIILSILILLGAGVGAFFLSKYFDEKNSTLKIPDAEFLVENSPWKENESDGKVTWLFKEDGTCEITTNGDEYFACQWYLDGKTLGIKTDWLVELEDEFEISFNKPNYTFETISKSDQKTSEFHSEKDTRAK